jgi:SHS2 domain-containing protein
MGSYQYIEHTADLGIEVSAESFEDLLVTMARAIVETLIAGKLNAHVKKTITCSGDTPEDLLVDWCRELLYLFEVHEFIPVTCTLTKTDLRVTATVYGDLFDRTRHEVTTDIKNVTYHNLLIRQTDREYRATVTFDI